MTVVIIVQCVRCVTAEGSEAITNTALVLSTLQNYQ